MDTEKEELWKSDAEAELLAGRAQGFWNIDYFRRKRETDSEAVPIRSSGY